MLSTQRRVAELVQMMTSWFGLACVISIGVGWVVFGCTYSIAEETPEPAKASLARTVKDLKQQLQGQKTVRVLIRLKEGPHDLEDREGSLGLQDRLEVRMARQQRFLENVKGEGIVSGKPLKGSPYMLMIVNEQGLDRLLATHQIEAIQPDRLQKPSGS